MNAPIDLDLLAADGDPRPTPPVERVHARAADLRRRRRRTTSVLSVGAVAAALAVGGVVLPQGSGPGGTAPVMAEFLGVVPASAAPGELDCRIGQGNEALPYADWAADPVAAALPVLLDSPDLPPMRSVSMGSETWNCPPAVPTAVLYADGSPVRALALYTDVANPYSAEGGLTDVAVRGTTAEMMTFDDGGRVLCWLEPDGTRWVAWAGGLAQDEAVGLLDVLVLVPEGGVEASSVPDGLLTADVPPQTTERSQMAFGILYGSPGREAPDAVHVSVSAVAGASVEWAATGAPGVVLTSVGGHLAEYAPGPDGHGRLRWSTGGLSYLVAGSGGVDRLVALAESMEHVAPDDPRLSAAVNLPESVEIGG
jgi:hypothetical protein